jgi:hypothetical protein
MPQKKKHRDPLEADFGPGAAPGGAAAPGRDAARTGGPIPGLACGGEGCVLRPAAGLIGKFSVSLVGRAALGRAASSGIEVMKALRDFLDEEIALAERASKRGTGPRYEKIKVD